VRVGAIVVLGGSASIERPSPFAAVAVQGEETQERLGGTPIAALDILGQSAVHRTIAYLQDCGLQPITLVVAEGMPVPANLSGYSTVPMPANETDAIWPVMGRVFDKYVQAGTETILLIRLGAYVEFDFSDLLQFHRDNMQPVTRLVDSAGPLDFWMLDALHCAAAGSDSLHETLARVKDSIAYYDQATYVNRLSSASDVRHLVVDAFSSRHAVRPSGREVKPGIWLDDNANVHSRARVAGPVYVGRDTRVQATALLARFSSVERSCNIGCGTVVADSSILANTHLGSWLDVSHAVIFGSKVAHLRHNVTVDIQDDRLLRRRVSVFRRFLPNFPGMREN